MSPRNIKKYSGLTLIEVVISVGILLLGMQGFTMLILKSWQNNAVVLELGQSAYMVSQGLNRLVGYVRSARQGDNGAYPIQSGSDNELIFFSDYDKDGKTERLHVYRSGRDVLMGVRKPSQTMPVTYANGDGQVLIIATNIFNDTNVPIFYYFNQDYPVDTTNNPLITPVSVSKVRLMKILLKVNIDPIRAPDNIEMQSFVEMRNLNDNN